MVLINQADGKNPMEPVIIALALVAVLSWVFSANWLRQEQSSSQDVITVEQPYPIVQELTHGLGVANSLPLAPPVNGSQNTKGQVAGEDYESWKREGDRLLVSKAYKEAIAAYEQAAKLRVNASYVWQQRGEALKRIQLYEEAIASYHKAIEVSANPISRYQAWNGLGALLFAIGRYEESIAAYDRALAICPNGMGSAQILQMEGMAWSRLKQYDEAGACYNQAYHKAVELSEKTARETSCVG